MAVWHLGTNFRIEASYRKMEHLQYLLVDYWVLFQVSWVRHADTHLLTVGRLVTIGYLRRSSGGNCQVKSINLISLLLTAVQFSLLTVLWSISIRAKFHIFPAGTLIPTMRDLEQFTRWSQRITCFKYYQYRWELKQHLQSSIFTKNLLVAESWWRLVWMPNQLYSSNKPSCLSQYSRWVHQIWVMMTAECVIQ